MSERPFELVFESLASADSDKESLRSLVLESERLAPEIEEIAELRRLIAEFAEPEPTSFTTS